MGLTKMLLVGALAVAPRLASADCALSGLSTGTIQGPELQIAADGGIVVAAQRVNRDTPEKTPGNHPEWNKPVTKATLGKDLGAAAPAVAKVSLFASMSRHSFESITVDLDVDPPAGVFAMVIADAKSGTPLSWGQSKVGRKQNPYEHGDCQMLPNGTVQPKQGDEVTVFWVTADGRVSPRSAKVKVR